MKALNKLNWKFWEYTLIVSGWLFGYGHEVYYSVKNKRNMAYMKYIFNKRG